MPKESGLTALPALVKKMSIDATIDTKLSGDTQHWKQLSNAIDD